MFCIAAPTGCQQTEAKPQDSDRQTMQEELKRLNSENRAQYAGHAYVPIGPGPGFPTSENYYPAEAMRAHESGAVGLRVCVGPDGKLSEPPAIAKSSGSSLFDNAALRLAKEGDGKYRPATLDGKPIADCAYFSISWSTR
jgi:TonB family protein